MKRTLWIPALAALTIGLGMAAIGGDKPASATELLNKAKKQAGKDKNVLVLFHASWCGWCKKTEAFMDDPKFKSFFDRNYVVVWVTVLESGDKKNLENPGGNELLASMNGTGAGIPFWGVYDSKGKLLFNSNIKADDPKTNIGHPAKKEEIAHYMGVLKKTAKHTDDKELAAIEKWLVDQKLG